MKLFWCPEYVVRSAGLETLTKSAWIVDSLERAPMAGVELVAPRPLTEGEVARVHEPGYVRDLRTRQRDVWESVTRSTGGAVEAALAALRDGRAGSLSSGLHHAKYDRAEGFCTFNGLVFAALAALEAGAGKVLILDLDAHCGGGTDALIGSDARVLHADIATNEFDEYAPRPPGTLEIVRDPARYLATVEARLRALEVEAEGAGVCLYNAGMDPAHDGVALADLKERERLVFDWCRRRSLPIAFVLAGGYLWHTPGLGRPLRREELVQLHRHTLEYARA